MTATTAPERVVERYYALVGDLDSSPDELADVLAAHAAGKRLLSEQTFELHEVLACGGRVAVRATWSRCLSAAERAPSPVAAGPHR